MICKKHQINMTEVNGRSICPMCEKGIPGDVVFFEKSLHQDLILEKKRLIAEAEERKKNSNGQNKESFGKNE